MAEDVAQTVLLRVHRSLREYSPAGTLTTWVYRITRNAVVHVERKTRREQARLGSLTRETLASRLSGRSDALELLGATDQLRRFMTVLSPQQRAVLDLVEPQGFTSPEVAEMLDIGRRLRGSPTHGPPGSQAQRPQPAPDSVVGRRGSTALAFRPAGGWPRRRDADGDGSHRRPDPGYRRPRRRIGRRYRQACPAQREKNRGFGSG